MKRYFLNILSLFTASILTGQQDTVKYQWPFPPFDQVQTISGTFCEFRNTLSSDHFHNAVDIPEPDGYPVYPCLDGIVNSIDAGSGINSYVRVRTLVDGKWKHITYLHILPNPNLSLGQAVVKGETILGTIYSGAGHTHLTERELVSSASSSGTAMNNLRGGGGLFPYNDSWAPVIYDNTLAFYIQGTKFTLPSSGLAGKIDIKIKIEEINGTSSSARNNGTYIAGYRIWDENKTQIIYEQFPDGAAYRFDLLPTNADVHNVFVLGEATLSNPVYWLTNGNGAGYINQNLRVNDNYLDTELIPEGNYQLEIFSEDTRQNLSNKFYPITITRDDVAPPIRPVLYGILNTDGKKSVKVIWSKNTEPDVKGYRLYYSVNTMLSTWALAADENTLANDIDEYFFESPSQFVEPAEDDIYFFYMTAVDSSGNESERSKIYSRSSFKGNENWGNALIVDGFTRYGGSGSWQQPVHSFNTNYFIPLTLASELVISSAFSDAVVKNKIDLNDFDLVIWFVGDESTTDNTFENFEQAKIAEYLEKGGRLIASGSEIGWDLDRQHTYSQPSDTLFYRHYLKAKFVYDGSSSMNIVSGKQDADFIGLVMNIGQVYPEDYPDDIDAVNGSEVILEYNQTRTGTSINRNAGVAFRGAFGSSSIPGAVIYLSFPLETVYSQLQRVNFFEQALRYFGIIVGVEEAEIVILPEEYFISQNFPNPFNPSTKIKIYLPEKSEITIEVFNNLGQIVHRLAGNVYNTGSHEFSWSPANLASGVYYARINAEGTNSRRRINKTISMIYLK